jgi:excinuclease ABC subunit B
VKKVAEEGVEYSVGPIPKDEISRLIIDLEGQMKAAAKNLEFEKAALLRDQIIELRRRLSDDEDPLAQLAMSASRQGERRRAAGGSRAGNGSVRYGRRRR